MESKALPLPYWYRLLDNWVCIQDNSGLSIPFLVGAKSISADGVHPNENSIKDLFRSVVTKLLRYIKILQYDRGLYFSENSKRFLPQSSLRHTHRTIKFIYCLVEIVPDIIQFSSE